MTYFVSRIVGWVIDPLILTFVLLGFSVACALISMQRLGRFFLFVSTIWLGVVLFTPFANLMAVALEGRFVRPTLPDHVDGIITLGGGLEFRIAHERNVTEQANAADRLYETVLLAKKFPDAKVVYTGSTNMIDGRRYSSGDIAKQYLTSLGVEESRIILEEDARNTFSNVVRSKALLNPKQDEVWVVVTSAYHMPRAIGVFRTQNWKVLPWPSDYQTHGNSAAYDFSYDAFSNVETLKLALHEWVGLISYRWLGRTTELFPAPDK